jgi:hypothetical protein
MTLHPRRQKPSVFYIFQKSLKTLGISWIKRMITFDIIEESDLFFQMQLHALAGRYTLADTVEHDIWSCAVKSKSNVPQRWSKVAELAPAKDCCTVSELINRRAASRRFESPYYRRHKSENEDPVRSTYRLLILRNSASLNTQTSL